MPATHRHAPAERLLDRLLLLLHLRRDRWLVRRTDITTVQDVDSVTWSIALQIGIDFDRIAADYPDLRGLSPATPLLLPLLTRTRSLLTRFDMRDHTGANVPMLTWDASRTLVGSLLVDVAQGVLHVRSGPLESLDGELAETLRMFGGDVDEVEIATEAINRWAATPEPDRRERQAAAILEDYTVRLLLGELSEGFIVIAPVTLREDGTADVFITADSPIDAGTLAIPVGASPHYQFEIRLPSGVVFVDRPDVRSAGTDELVPIGTERHARESASPAARPGGVAPWIEVHGPLLAGYAPNRDREARWELRLLGDPEPRVPVHRLPGGLAATVDRLFGRLPFDRHRRVPLSIRSAAFLPTRVRLIAWLTFAMFAAGSIARAMRIVPVEGTAAALLVALPSAYSALLLQSSDIPSREVVSERPRAWLVVLTLVTFLGAADLVVRFPTGAPFLDRWSVGFRALAWGVLTVATLLIARHVDTRSRTAW